MSCTYMSASGQTLIALRYVRRTKTLKELYHKINGIGENRREVYHNMSTIINTFQEIGNLQWHNFLIILDNHGVIFPDDLNRK